MNEYGAIIFVVLIALIGAGFSAGFSQGYSQARENFLDSPASFARHTLDWQHEGNLDRNGNDYPGTAEAKHIAEGQ